MKNKFASLLRVLALGGVLVANIVRGRKDVIYVVENRDWSIRHDGRMILRNLNLSGATTTFPILARAKVMHYGSINTFLSKSLRVKRGLAKKHVLTWFHIEPNDPRLPFLKENIEFVDVIHTSTSLTRKKMIDAGIPADMVKVIPLGVDLKIFRPAPDSVKQEIRARLKVPGGAFVIGSFQKDGEGWLEGLSPKMIKGPDLFCRALVEVHNRHPNLFVLLTGPARGYVKVQLAAAHIPFLHVNLRNQEDVVEYYQAIDAYLIASREEGGPKAVLESMASGVPLVTTPVGMVPDMCVNGVNALVASGCSAEELSRLLDQIISSPELAAGLALAAVESAQHFDWSKIAKRYESELYA